MMPALLITTLRPGKSATSFAAKARMLAASSMLRIAEAMPGLAAAVSSRNCLRRPAMMTLFPSLWKASARPRPIPEPPPVIRILLPVIFIVGFVSCDHSRVVHIPWEVGTKWIYTFPKESGGMPNKSVIKTWKTKKKLAPPAVTDPKVEAMGSRDY